MGNITQNIYRKIKGNKQRCGLLVAVADEATKTVKIGFSLCMKTDVFNKEMAEKIALGRTKAARLAIP